MLVRFDSNKTDEAKYRWADPGLLKEDELYVVFGVSCPRVDEQVRPAFLIQFDRTLYPLKFDSTFFDVEDGRLSKFWVFQRSEVTRENNSGDAWRLVFPEWHDDFYYQLVDSGEGRNIFDTYAELMRREYPHPDVSTEARGLSDDWVMCPKCTESWEVAAELALTRCPGCDTFWRNPYWTNINTLKFEKFLASTDRSSE